jgi:hypothetical protein
MVEWDTRLKVLPKPGCRQVCGAEIAALSANELAVKQGVGLRGLIAQRSHAAGAGFSEAIGETEHGSQVTACRIVACAGERDRDINGESSFESRPEGIRARL